MSRGPGRNGRPWLRLSRRLMASATHCSYCGGLLRRDLGHNHPLAPTVDHRVALADGGHPTDPANLTVVHRGCNSRKENARRRQRKLNASRDW